MKKIISIILIIMVIFSCTREDYFERINKNPEVLIKQVTDSLFHESIIDSVKKGFDYQFNYKIENEQLLGLKLVKSQNITGQVDSINGLISLTVADTLGNQIIYLNTADCYGKTASATLNLYVFENLSPVAVLEISDTELYDKLEMNFSAAHSYDKDSKWGGKIVEYEFKIGTTYNLVTKSNNISYIFPTTGNYLIAIRVKDNNSEWSPWVQQDVIVN